MCVEKAEQETANSNCSSATVLNNKKAVLSQGSAAKCGALLQKACT